MPRIREEQNRAKIRQDEELRANVTLDLKEKFERIAKKHKKKPGVLLREVIEDYVKAQGKKEVPLEEVEKPLTAEEERAARAWKEKVMKSISYDIKPLDI